MNIFDEPRCINCWIKSNYSLLLNQINFNQPLINLAICCGFIFIPPGPPGLPPGPPGPPCLPPGPPAVRNKQYMYYRFGILCDNFIFATYFRDKALKSKLASKIMNRYNQVPHLTQGTNGKAKNSQLDTTNESQEVSLFPAGDYKAHINRRAERHSKHKTEKNIKDPQKKYCLGKVSKYILLEGLNRFKSANLSLNSDVDQDT